MFLIAGAFFYMNRADPDAGTTFSWVTSAMGPYAGWIGGWAVTTTGILVVGSLADVGARYFYLLIGADGAAGSKVAVTVLAVAIIVVMTAICVIGTELSARLQNVLTLFQVAALLIFAAVALIKVLHRTTRRPTRSRPTRRGSRRSTSPASRALVSALLLGVFIYWGWESAVNLTEETTDSTRSPGAGRRSLDARPARHLRRRDDRGRRLRRRAAGRGRSTTTTRIFSTLGDERTRRATGIGSSSLAIVISAISSCQTTIIPASRTTFSMGRAGAFPARSRTSTARFRTPAFSTIVVAVLATLWYVPANFISENFLFDTLSALSLMIAFYYGLSGSRAPSTTAAS